MKRGPSGELLSRQPDGKAVPHRGYRQEDQMQSDAVFDAAGS